MEYAKFTWKVNYVLLKIITLESHERHCISNPATWLFVGQLIQDKVKQPSKLNITGPFCLRELPVDSPEMHIEFISTILTLVSSSHNLRENLSDAFTDLQCRHIIAPQNFGDWIVYSKACSGTKPRKTSQLCITDLMWEALNQWLVDSPHKGP